MKILALIGIGWIAYYGCQVFLTWKDAKKKALERQAANDIEMQRIITDVKTKVIKFEPRRKR